MKSQKLDKKQFNSSPDYFEVKLANGKTSKIPRITNDGKPLQKLVNYQKLYSKSATNGVFLLSKAAKRPAHNNTIGPMGWDTKNHPIGGAKFGGMSAYNVIWNASVAYIVYAEATPATEAHWLQSRIHPVASHNLPEFLYKLYTAAFSVKDLRAQLIARKVAEDLGFKRAFITRIYNHYKLTGSISPEDEDKLASVLNNPKRQLMA